MRGGLYLFYDLDARTYRTPHWVWGWGPSAGLLLEAREMPEMNALFGSSRLLKAAEGIGDASLRTVSHDPSHPARGIPISRWDRSPRFDYGHELAITPCDAAFLAGWTWVRLWEATGDTKWRDASTTLAASLERLMAEFPIPPQNYWPDYGRWDTKVIDEAGFGVELFAELHRVTGDARMRELGRRYIEQHIAALGRPDGLWDRTHFLDGRPNTPTIRMTRGLGWPMEGLLAAHRLLPEEGRYLDLARQMAEHLMAAQKPEGWWVHRFDQPVEEWGIGTKGTALWCWLFYELHRHTNDPRHLSAARRALAWLLDEQEFGEDPHARGGHVTVSPHSAVGYRPWYRVTCTYGAAFYGLALLQELEVQASAIESTGEALNLAERHPGIVARPRKLHELQQSLP
jgi:rhamnogalacturonyl hydrolase YesR